MPIQDPETQSSNQPLKKFALLNKINDLQTLVAFSRPSDQPKPIDCEMVTLFKQYRKYLMCNKLCNQVFSRDEILALTGDTWPKYLLPKSFRETSQDGIAYTIMMRIERGKRKFFIWPVTRERLIGMTALLEKMAERFV